MLTGRLAKWMATTALIGVLAAPSLLPGSTPAFAQDTVTPIALPPQASYPGPIFTQEQIDAMVAPIALYPDQLLGDVLMAATYPAEIAEADRWAHDPAAAGLRGEALAGALAPVDWDPSVKSLVPFPQVLDLMAGHMDWTQQLGDAFLAQQGQVMEAVQRLRREALAAGYLRPTPQLAVMSAGGIIVIEPASPELLYVPVYDPAVIYGPWPYPEPPIELYPRARYGAPIVFTAGFVIVRSFWDWHRWDWSHHRMDVDPPRVNAINARLIEHEHRPRIEAKTWRVDPSRRRGAPPVAAPAMAPSQARPHAAPGHAAPAAPLAPQARHEVRAPEPPRGQAYPMESEPRARAERSRPSPQPAAPHPVPHGAIVSAPHPNAPRVEAHPGPAAHPAPPPHPAIAAAPHPTPPHAEAHPAPAPHGAAHPAPHAPEHAQSHGPAPAHAEHGNDHEHR